MTKISDYRFWATFDDGDICVCLCYKLWPKFWLGIWLFLTCGLASLGVPPSRQHTHMPKMADTTNSMHA